MLPRYLALYVYGISGGNPEFDYKGHSSGNILNYLRGINEGAYALFSQVFNMSGKPHFPRDKLTGDVRLSSLCMTFFHGDIVSCFFRGAR